MTQPTLDSRRILLRGAAAGVTGLVVAAAPGGVASPASAAAERRANNLKACRRFKRRSKRRRCRVRVRRRRRRMRKDRLKSSNKPSKSTPPPPTPSQPHSTPDAPVLGASERHLVSRFSYGLNAELAAEVTAAGGARAWFDRQLDSASIDDAAADGLVHWWSSLRRDSAELWLRQESGIEGGWEVMEDYRRWLLVRRMQTRRQVKEVMTEFWLNHLNVPANGDAQFTYRTAYDTVIREGSLGRFEDLLVASITHPAMGIYLNNAVSTAQHPNENLGRELLELHTVGRGAYDEDDVKNSARILTGFRVDLWRTFDSFYSPKDHWTGPVRVMDFSDANSSSDGRGVTERYLRYLARHPRTAQRIARKLAVKFVRDDPPQALVDRLAAVYLATTPPSLPSCGPWWSPPSSRARPV